MLAVVKIRGNINVKPKLRTTLECLKLSRANQLVLVLEEQLPMLKKVESYVTWGEIDEPTLEKLLQKRARLPGDKKIEKDFLKKHGFASVKALANALLEQKTTLQKLGLKTVFRLNPPTKGFERGGVKKPYALGGALGYRAADINNLIRRMV